MRKIFFIRLSLLALLISWSIGHSVAQSDYKLDYFDEISVAGNIEVLLVKGDAEKAVMQTYGIPEDEVNISVKSQTLKLSLLNSLFYKNKNERVRITVTYKELRSIRANAGAEIKSDEIIEADLLEVHAGSGAQVNLQVKVNKLDGSATEGGILQLKGEAENQKAQANTGGQYRAFDVECKNTYARAGTGGEVEIVARESLDAYASLGGQIEYKGDPDERYHRKFIGGEVRKVNF
ncbi:MAG: head GIN domain-containing protein [Saprospiraceae bacterium]|nr:head GIN domain-containing protein [Saprospiraceae bacterium]